MGLIGTLLSFLRTEVDDAQVSEATIDPGGGANLTVQHFSSPGDDARPLPGDFVATTESPGTGNAHVTGYLDPNNAGEAAAGEKRLYARDGDGVIVAVVWLKNDGEILIDSVAGGVVRVAADGNVHLGASTGAAKMSRADRVDAEINRIWTVLTTWVPSPNDGGAALKVAAVAQFPSNVQATGADKVHGT